MIVAVLYYHSSITTIMVKSDNILCINHTIKTVTVRKQVRNMLKRLLFSSRQAFLLSKTTCKAAWDPGVPATETRVCTSPAPGSARNPDGDAEKFISHVGDAFMPCFCILFDKKGRFMPHFMPRFIFKRPRFVDGCFCTHKHKYHVISYINK